MKQAFMVLCVLGLGLWSLLRQIGAEPEVSPPSEEVEVERRFDVMKRHEKELRDNPDVLGLLPSEEAIIIVTDRPESMPKEIEGVPVKTIPPPPTLPPPPGVIVLRPGEVREHLKDADSCPPGFREEKKYRWRFCESLSDPQPIPTEIMTPPIAGIPFEEAKKILEQNAEQLSKLPGVSTIRLEQEGIVIETTQPELVPVAVEGVPIKTVPPQEYHLMNHTFTTSVRPFPLRGVYSD